MSVKYVEVKLNPNKTIERELDACAGVLMAPEEIRAEEDVVVIDGVGTVPYKGPSVLPTSYEGAKVLHRGGRWYVSFYVQPRVRPLPKTGKSVGVDFGVRHLVCLSDGRYTRPNGDLVRLDKLIKKQLNELDSKHTDSTRYRETLRRIERNQERMRDIQIDTANKIAKSLTENYDLLCLEAVDVKGKGIQHDPLYKQASERQNWRLLIDVIKLRAYETGREVMMVPPFFTSQECGECGGYCPKPLDARTHLCRRCGFRTTRDRNAAMVIRRRGIAIRNGSRRTDWRPKGHPQWVDQD